MTIGRNLSKYFDFLGEILAVLTIMLIAFLFINANFGLIGSADTVSVLTAIRDYAILGTLIIVGLEFSVKRSFCPICDISGACRNRRAFHIFLQAVPQFLRS